MQTPSTDTQYSHVNILWILILMHVFSVWSLLLCTTTIANQPHSYTYAHISLSKTGFKVYFTRNTHTHSLATLQWITGKTFSILVWWDTVYVLYVCLCTGWLHICYLVWRLKNLFFLGLVLRKPIDYDYFINTCLFETFSCSAFGTIPYRPFSLSFSVWFRLLFKCWCQ